MDISDNVNLGLPSSFDYYSKTFEPSLIPKDLYEPSFTFAPMKDPSQFTEFIKDQKGDEKKIMDLKKGTTTMGFVFKEGVLLIVDSRATMGEFINSGTVRKIIEINDYLLGTMAGGAADCSFWERWLAQQCKVYQLQNNERPSVAAASKMLGNVCYQYKGYGLSMGTMIAGWDKTGPHLWYIDSDGTRIKGNSFAVGSGSTFAYGVLDQGYKYDLSLKEAVDLGVRAVQQATYMDSASGGVIRVYHIHKDGWTIIHEALNVDELHYKFQKEKNMDGCGDEIKADLI